MKAIKILAAAALAAAPLLSFAQSTEGITRAQVRAELTELQKAGYNPASDQTQYPQNIQAALERIHAGDVASSSAYGGMKNDATHAGVRVSSRVASSDTNDVTGLGPIYKNP
jgi:hypothetical protein